MVPDLHLVLHDHYKETFSYIRDREKQRDRLFVVVILLLAANVLLLRYAATLPNIDASVNFIGISLAIKEIPFAVVLSLSWTLLTLISLRHLQAQTIIDKQYDYLHKLELRLSMAIGEQDVISREGTAYLSAKGSIFRHATWFFYLFVVPAILLATCIFALVMEWREDLIPTGHKVYDSGLATVLIVSMLLFLWDTWWHKQPVQQDNLLSPAVPSSDENRAPGGGEPVLVGVGPGYTGEREVDHDSLRGA